MDAARSDRVADEHCDPLTRGDAVLPLSAVLAGADREHGSDQSRREPFDDARTLRLVQRGRRTEIEAELDARIGGVHPLAARPRGARELLEQFARRNHESMRRARPGKHTQIIHSTIVAQRDERCDAVDGRIV